MRVLAARDLFAVEQHVRDRVEPRDDEVDGRVRERLVGVDVKGALERPDLLCDVAVLPLIEAVKFFDRACKKGEEKREMKRVREKKRERRKKEDGL